MGVARQARLFARYYERAVAHLDDLISAACTLNELNLGILLRQWSFLHIEDTILKAPWRAAAARACGIDPEQFSSFPLLRAQGSQDTDQSHRHRRQTDSRSPHRFFLKTSQQEILRMKTTQSDERYIRMSRE